MFIKLLWKLQIISLQNTAKYQDKRLLLMKKRKRRAKYSRRIGINSSTCPKFSWNSVMVIILSLWGLSWVLTPTAPINHSEVLSNHFTNVIFPHRGSCKLFRNYSKPALSWMTTTVNSEKCSHLSSEILPSNIRITQFLSWSIHMVEMLNK